jgi:hypothetical protein
MAITPAIKGTITSVLMIAVILLSFHQIIPDKLSPENFVYILYGAGIAWALIAYQNQPDFTGKFKDNFAQGFKTFMVITLIMSVFTFVFNYQHPEFAKESAQKFKTEMIQENKKTPAEIETATAEFEKQFSVMILSGSIFGYLIFGAVVTLVTSLFLTRRNQ